MNKSIIYVKCENFSVLIIEIYKLLIDKKEFVMSKQLLKSSTSIGANVAESRFAQSKKDFISKMHIALKETAETEYWIKLLYKSEYIDEKSSVSLLTDCLEIKRILIASINTAKSKNHT